MQNIDISDFNKIELRIGTIVNVKDFPEVKKKAYKLLVDLGDLGTKQASAQITSLYKKDDLVGKQVICVCNLPPRQVADFLSEVLVTGFVTKRGNVVLAVPDRDVENGLKLM